METARKWANPDRLLKLLTEQRALYQRLQELSRLQRGLISGERPELLLNILRDRQKLVSALAEINQQLTPFRQDWEGVYEQLPEDARRAASELLRQINEMLTVILDTDQEDGALLAARKQSVADSLADLAGGHAANTAYGRAPRGGRGGADLTA